MVSCVSPVMGTIPTVAATHTAAILASTPVAPTLATDALADMETGTEAEAEADAEAEAEADVDVEADVEADCINSSASLSDIFVSSV